MLKRTIIASSILLPLVSVLWLSFPGGPAHACIRGSSWEERLARYEQEADVVFSGRVTGIARYPVTRRDSYAIEVAQIWKGSVPQKVDVLAPYAGFCSDWRHPPDVGDTYKVYGDRVPGQPGSVDAIAGTTPDADCHIYCRELGGERTPLIAGIALTIVGAVAVLILFRRRRNQANQGSG